MNYAFEHQGKAYTQDRVIDAPDMNKHNKEVEAKELEWLRTAPDKVTLYVKASGSTRIPFSSSGRRGERNQSFGPYAVHTRLGTVLDANALVGHEVWSNLDFWTHKRSVSCHIFGTLYHGWFMESSGDYCRLKRAKRQ